MIIVSIDPGKMTGYGIVNTSSWNLAQFDQEEYFEIQKRLDEFSTIFSGDLHFVTEKFVITQRTLEVSRGDWSTKINGCAEYFAWRDGQKYTEQTAGDAKKFASDALLKRFGWYNKGQDHARDAARHALLYIARNVPEQFDLMLRETEDGI